MIDTEFWYPSFPGGCQRDAVCHIRIFGNVVIATELAKNQGKSITNAIPELAEAVADRFNLNRQKLVWIEHYNAGSYRGLDRAEDFARVTFAQTNPKIVGDVQWKHITPDAVADLIGRSFTP